MAFPKYSQFQLLSVSQGCFSPLVVKKDQRKFWMLLGNQQLSPGKIDCNLDSSNTALPAPQAPFHSKVQRKLQASNFYGPRSHPYTTLIWCYSTDCWAITPDLHPQEKAAAQCWIPLIIISQTGFRPEQSWRTIEVLLDYNLCIIKQTGLRATFASCYHHVFISVAPGKGLYGPGRGPWLLCFFISHKTRTTTETPPWGKSHMWAEQAPCWG